MSHTLQLVVKFRYCKLTASPSSRNISLAMTSLRTRFAAVLTQPDAVQRWLFGAGGVLCRGRGNEAVLGCVRGRQLVARIQRAKRSPEYAHRACGGKKFRYVRRQWPGEVADEPPRSTCWFTMNLPLYSPTAPSAMVNPG